MTRYAGNQITTMVQILNPDNSPATTASVTAIVYDYEGEVFSTTEMTHLANGIFVSEWTPEEDGDWLVECICGSPVTRQSFQYHVEQLSLRGYVLLSNNVISKLSGLAEQDIWVANQASPEPANYRHIVVELDLTALTQQTRIRLYKSNSEGNYRLVSNKLFPDDYDSDIKLVVTDVGFVPWYASTGTPANISLQSLVSEGAVRDIPVRYFEEYKSAT